MWNQWFNRNFMKLREYFLCTKKTKIMTLFNNFFAFVSVIDVCSRQYHNASHGLFCIAFLSTEGQKALGFHQKYLNLCSVDEQRFYGFGMTWGWIINDRIFILGWTIPLRLGIGTDWFFFTWDCKQQLIIHIVTPKSTSSTLETT